jgi:pimeloyl-ACP methyl ester carboxylesterase
MKKPLNNELKKIKCPVNIYWAKKDELIPFKHSKKFLELIPHAKLYAPIGHHNWIISKTKEIEKYFL